MRKLLRFLALSLVVVVVLAVGAFGWASASTSRFLSRTIESHAVDFPIPYPLPQEEVEALGLTPEMAADVALENAIERGGHLVGARYPCAECHGTNFGGGVMIDAFPIGTLLGPNLTQGRGSRVVDYTPADWDRAVRHGILPDGRPSIMPSEEFFRMSDQELSDIIAYIQSLPNVDNEVPGPKFGPLGRVLIATGQITASADLIPTHDQPHREVPPVAAVNTEFGEHLAATCVGCHRMTFDGGPIAGGDPAWPPAANLTPHPDGLAGWSYEDFRRAMLEARRPDGTALAPPMDLITPFAARMTDVEMEAIWAYLSSLEARPTGG
jgi:mono/diheme cytochrome c family protein